jgi:hypothetical protein
MITALAVGPVKFDVIVSNAWLKGRASPPAAKAAPGRAVTPKPAASPRASQREDIKTSWAPRTGPPGSEAGGFRAARKPLEPL